MNTLKKTSSSQGFTLIELLIAMVLSSFVMLGVHSMFSGVLTSKTNLDKTNDAIIIVESFQRFLAKDIRMMIPTKGKTDPLDEEDGEMLKLLTYNSLTFNKSIPVDVFYSFDNNTIYREEKKTGMNYLMRIPMLRDVESWKVETYDGSDYEDGFTANGYIYRFTIKFFGKQFQFIAGRAVNVVAE